MAVHWMRAPSCTACARRPMMQVGRDVYACLTVACAKMPLTGCHTVSQGAAGGWSSTSPTPLPPLQGWSSSRRKGGLAGAQRALPTTTARGGASHATPAGTSRRCEVVGRQAASRAVGQQAALSQSWASAAELTHPMHCPYCCPQLEGHGPLEHPPAVSKVTQLLFVCPRCAVAT